MGIGLPLKTMTSLPLHSITPAELIEGIITERWSDIPKILWGIYDMQDNPKIGIIGGSEWKTSFIPNAKSKSVNTVYGNPSSKLMIGMIDDVEVNIISRHGLNHTISQPMLTIELIF